MLGGSALGVPLGYTDVQVIEYDEGIKLGSTGDELLHLHLDPMVDIHLRSMKMLIWVLLWHL